MGVGLAWGVGGCVMGAPLACSGPACWGEGQLRAERAGRNGCLPQAADWTGRQRHIQQVSKG